MARRRLHPITVAYFYRVRWGAQEEFLELFERNHWPLLREQLAAGRFLDVQAYVPRFHGDGRADWTVMVTITYRDWAAMEAHSEAAIAAAPLPRPGALPGGGAPPLRAAGGPLGRAPRTTGPAALTPDPVLGFYGPGSRMWRINREAVLLGAGPTALLLQLAHPLVAEGVAAHSDFEADPAGRLRRTLRTTLALVFGDGPAAEAAVRRLNGVHATRARRRRPIRTPRGRGATVPGPGPGTPAVGPGDAHLDERPGVPSAGWDPSRRRIGRRSGPRRGRSGRASGIPLDESPADWPALRGVHGPHARARGARPRHDDRAAPRAAGGARAAALPAGPRGGRLMTLPAVALLPPIDPRRLRAGVGAAPRAAGRRPGPCGAPVGPRDAAGVAGDAAGQGGRRAGPPAAIVPRGTIGLPAQGVKPAVPEQDLARRAVVTGLGAITPIGNDHPTFWRNLVAGVSGGGPITQLRRQPATTCASRPRSRTSIPTSVMDRKMARRMSRFIHLGHGRRQGGRRRRRPRLRGVDPGAARSRRPSPSTPAAAAWSRSSTGTHDARAARAPVRSARSPSRPCRARWPPASSPWSTASPARSSPRSPPAPARVIAFLDGAAHDPAAARSTSCSPAARRRRCCRSAFAALGNMGALSKRNDDPTHASRPFDRDRDGFLFGEGAGVVVLESASPCAGPRRDHPCRGHRRRHSPPTRSTSAPRSRPVAARAAGHDHGHARRRRRARRGRLHRRPRHLDAAQRRDRDAGHQGRLRRARLQGAPSARPSRWSATCSAPPASSARLTAIGAIREGVIAADGQPGAPGPARVRPGLHAPRGAPAPASTRR